MQKFIKLNDLTATRIRLSSIKEYHIYERMDKTGHVTERTGLNINSKCYEYLNIKLCLYDLNKLDKHFDLLPKEKEEDKVIIGDHH